MHFTLSMIKKNVRLVRVIKKDVIYVVIMKIYLNVIAAFLGNHISLIITNVLGVIILLKKMELAAHVYKVIIQ